MNVKLPFPKLGVAWRFGIGLRQDLGKAASDDGRNLRHEVADFLPFLRQQVLFELGMNGPLRLNLGAYSADLNAKELDVP